jgi:exodeoxyribonuclease V alpha subunit
MVGDPAQLPSVGPGNVLRDVISTGLFPTVNLTEIFRQEETSDIVLAAHKTFRGEIPDYGSGKGSDFVLVEESDEDAILHIATKLVERLYGKRENFQVLSPRHAGTLGVTNLNHRLRTVLNPQSPGLQEHRLGSETIREDDRVMVVKNNYQLRIYNGDVGKVVRIDRKAREIEIKIHGPPVTHVRIPFKDAPKYLRLAYCVTVHKSQGQEYDVIVMPLVKGFHHQLQRNLFYTAITRARRRVILIGQREALVKAVLNNREDVRNTLFPDRLALAFEGGSIAAVGGR